MKVVKLVNSLPSCTFKTKRDIKQYQFDKQQLMIYDKINSVRSKLGVSNFRNRRKKSNLKTSQMREERQAQIDSANSKLFQNISKIIKRK